MKTWLFHSKMDNDMMSAVAVAAAIITRFWTQPAWKKSSVILSETTVISDSYHVHAIQSPRRRRSAQKNVWDPLPVPIRFYLDQPNLVWNRCGEECVFTGSCTMPFPGKWALVSPNFGTSYMRPHGMTWSHQILHGDQSRWEENFYSIHHAPLLRPKIFVTQMLTA